MKNIFVFSLLICAFSIVGYGQSSFKVQQFNTAIKFAIGDLNKDGKVDSVMVTQDTAAETAPYKVEVYLKQSNGSYKLFSYSTQLLIPEYPDGRDGYRHGISFENITIQKGVLLVTTSLLRGSFTHKFRYQNNAMELIGYTYASSNGIGTIEEIDFNLSTGLRIEKETNYETDQVIRRSESIRKIRPLPKLEEVIPFEHDLY